MTNKEFQEVNIHSQLQQAAATEKNKLQKTSSYQLNSLNLKMKMLMKLTLVNVTENFFSMFKPNDLSITFSLEQGPAMKQ